jgi:hypothetical protein
MSTHWSDEQVASLPVAQGRGELLEEIMNSSTETSDLAAATERRTARRSWLVPAAAAAAVAALAVVATIPLWGSDDGGSTAPAGPPGSTSAPADPAPLTQLALVAPGWTIDYTDFEGDEEQEVNWVLDADPETSVQIKRMPARPGSTLATYTPQYRDVSDPDSDGEPTTIAGLEGRQWYYTPTNRVVALEPTGGYWYAVRARSMDDAAFAKLVPQLRLVDQDTLLRALPEDFVMPEEAAPTAQRILDEITTVTGTGLPPGTEQPTSDEFEPYQFAADITSAYVCGWIGVYVDAKASGDLAAATEAQRVLGTSRTWPVLLEMKEKGGWSEVIWDTSDEIGRGRVRTPHEYETGLGCDGD